MAVNYRQRMVAMLLARVAPRGALAAGQARQALTKHKTRVGTIAPSGGMAFAVNRLAMAATRLAHCRIFTHL